MQATDKEPRLAKPGAGLPLIEWAIAKFILIPRRFKSVTPNLALEEIDSEAHAIREMAAPLTTEQLRQRRLIPRPRGLEDSSRYWSIAMTIQHVVIVNNLIRHVVLGLSQGKIDEKEASIAAVKPPADVDPATIITTFEQASKTFIEQLSTVELERFPNAKYAHPWFGPLNAREWLLFAAPHMRIHKGQIAEIIKRL